jgi:DnaJ-class molecular chaperone
MKKKVATKAVRKQAKKTAKCPRCNGQGFVETPSAINPGRTFRVICTACN